MILGKLFAEPDFSAQKLAAAAGLSERYVNELLYEAGASFTLRLNELRLRKAAELLARCRAPHQRHRLRLRLQRSVLLQPLLPPPVRPDAERGEGAVDCREESVRRRRGTALPV